MIYTIGHRLSYDEALDKRMTRGESLLKMGRGEHLGRPYEGASCWETREAAQAYLDTWRERYDAYREGRGPYVSLSDPHEFAVYGLDADWKMDTYKAGGTDLGYRSLKRDAAVIKLEGV